MFLGTPEISANILESLILAGYNVFAIVSQQDKEKNRKGELLETPTKKIGKKYNIPVYQYDRMCLHVDEVKELNPDLIITLAYGQLIPQSILDIPTYGCINLHGSILPKYRGAAPIQRSIMNGDKTTGFTLMQMIDKMDAGLMYAKKEINIEENDNFSSVLIKMTNCAKELILETLDDYLLGKLPGEVQNEEEVTIAKKINKDDEKLSFDFSCHEFINMVRGLSDEPCGFVFLDDEILKIFKAHYVSDKKESDVGTIVKADKNGIILQLKDGQISIDILQKQQKKKMLARDFVNGCHDLVGKVLK